MNSPSSEGGNNFLSPEGDDMGLYHTLHLTSIVDQKIKWEGRVIKSFPRKVGKQSHSEQ